MKDKNIIVERHLKQLEKHTLKQKLRDTRRKAGPKGLPKKPRMKKISPSAWDDMGDLETMDYDVFEPVMPRGERERRRTIEKQALQRSSYLNHSELEESVGDNPLTQKGKTTLGLVVEAGSGMCRVDIEGGIMLCDIRGTVKNKNTRYVNVVAVGDKVQISRIGSDRGIVESVQPRRCVLSRPYSPDVGKTSYLEQIVVANVDQLLIVASWREPFLWPALIDRYLITAQRNKIEAIICINKVDLLEDKNEFNAIVDVYQSLGYRLLLTSAVMGLGIPELRKILEDSTTVLAGLSGVGKSSLLTAVQPTLNLKIGNVSEHGLFTGQGRHTTTQSTLWRLDNNSVVVDTPGVRSFGIAGINPTQLSDWYPEMVSHAHQCRFGNCSHINEPDCGVITAVERGLISRMRYKSYTQIFEELEP
jgi:ribosome biogenesis GTPase